VSSGLLLIDACHPSNGFAERGRGGEWNGTLGGLGFWRQEFLPVHRIESTETAASRFVVGRERCDDGMWRFSACMCAYRSSFH
jgi:hypothetical protein